MTKPTLCPPESGKKHFKPNDDWSISGNWNISETNYILTFPWIFLGMWSCKRNAFWKQQQMQQQSCSSKEGHAVKDQHRNKTKSPDDINQALCDQLSTTICHPKLVASSDVRDLLTWKQDREAFRESGLTQEWTSIWVLCPRHLFIDLKKEKKQYATSSTYIIWTSQDLLIALRDSQFKNTTQTTGDWHKEEADSH